MTSAQYQILPETTRINVVSVDKTDFQADVTEALNIAKWDDQQTVETTFIGAGVKAGDGYVYTPVVWVGGNYLLQSSDTGSGISLVSTIDSGKVVLGPDGRIWCCSPGTKNVKAYDVSNVSSSYTLAAMTNTWASAGAGYSSLVVGSDGNLWAVDGTTQKIVVFNTSGVFVAEYTYAGVTRGYSLAAGADGRIWAAYSGGLYAIDTAGTITNYVSPVVAPLEVHASSDSCLFIKSHTAFCKIDTQGNVLKLYNFPSTIPPVISATYPALTSTCEVGGSIFLTDSYGRIFSIELKTDRIRFYRSVTITRPQFFACFDSESIFCVNNGFAFRFYVSGGLMTSLVAEGERVSQINPLPIYIGASPRNTYIACNPQYVIPATPTDMIVIGGSASKTVKIRKIRLFLQQTTGNNNQYFLIKRSTADSGGTPNAVTWVPCDSKNPAATATFNYYTANPTLGTAVGNIVIGQLVCWSAASGAMQAWYDLYDEDISGQPITLRGVAEQLAINFGGAALPAGMKVQAEVHITEEDR